MLAAALEGQPVVWPLCQPDNVSGALLTTSVLIFLPILPSEVCGAPRGALGRALPQEVGNLNI